MNLLLSLLLRAAWEPAAALPKAARRNPVTQASALLLAPAPGLPTVAPGGVAADRGAPGDGHHRHLNRRPATSTSSPQQRPQTEPNLVTSSLYQNLHLYNSKRHWKHFIELRTFIIFPCPSPHPVHVCMRSKQNHDQHFCLRGSLRYWTHKVLGTKLKPISGTS